MQEEITFWYSVFFGKEDDVVQFKAKMMFKARDVVAGFQLHQDLLSVEDVVLSFRNFFNNLPGHNRNQENLIVLIGEAERAVMMVYFQQMSIGFLVLQKLK